jgi:hypothetical protein
VSQLQVSIDLNFALTFFNNVSTCIFICIYFIRQRRNHDKGTAKKYKGKNGSKQNGMYLLQRNFEMRPVSDTYWAIKDVTFLVNYILIKYKIVYIPSLLLS